MKFILLDLDNTIADDGWRIPYINWDVSDPFTRYHDYHCLSAFDTVGNKHIVNVEGTMQIIMTARPKMYERLTREWLARNGIKFGMLMMRPNDNFENSVKLKKGFLDSLVEIYKVDKSRMLAYDDRQDVIDMYGLNGVKAELISIHSNNAYKPTEKGKA